LRRASTSTHMQGRRRLDTETCALSLREVLVRGSCTRRSARILYWDKGRPARPARPIICSKDAMRCTHTPQRLKASEPSTVMALLTAPSWPHQGGDDNHWTCFLSSCRRYYITWPTPARVVVAL